MKDKIHPKYYPECKVFCGGEQVMVVGATVPELHLEVWAGTHPFYTGNQIFVDTAGRIEKFTKKFGGGTAYFSKKEEAKTKPAAVAKRGVKSRK